MQNPKLEIAFFGSSIVSAYWNGAATYYRGIVRALSQLGHSITFYEPDAYGRQQHRDIEDPEWCRVVVYEAGQEAVEEVLQQASGADVIVKASGVGVFDEFLEAAIPRLKQEDNMVVFWDVDAPATLERMQHDAQDPFRSVVGLYDLVFTYGGGQPVIDAYRKLGARKCIPIYNALDTTTHFPDAPQERYSADLAFLGNRLPDRERRVEEFFLQPARLLPDRRFIIGGSGWADKSMPSNVQHVGHVYTADHNAFNSTPLAVLNISRDSMASFGFSPATRVFEAAGAGACLITDHWRGIEQFFEPGREILVAEDGEEVVRILSNLTAAEARRIGEAAYARVCDCHTYVHRAAQVQEILGACFSHRQPSPAN